jgi:hypothetical protein
LTAAKGSRAPLPRGNHAAITSVISSLNAELAARVDESQLAAADVVLRAAIVGESGQRRAQRLVRPPS